MTHPYLSFSDSSSYPGKLCVGTSKYISQGNGLSDKSVTKVEIPSFVGDKEVVELGFRSFHGTRIQSIFISKTILYINYCAFESCVSLVDVRFEEGSKLTKLDYFLFYNCQARFTVVECERACMCP